jgi:hypothetical protein
MSSDNNIQTAMSGASQGQISRGQLLLVAAYFSARPSLPILRKIFNLN